ncbi:MAG: SPOR domain-containing protein [Hydrogenophaga sp.]
MKQASWSGRAQRGGTLVGFVVGLLVGLGIALSVAVYVTRVPVPFVDRGVSRSSAQDAQEAERNKGWDPNAQLAGKPAAPPADAATATAPAPGEGPPPAAVPAAAAAKTAPAAPAKPSADPIGDLLNAKLGAAAGPQTGEAAAAGAVDPFVYFVQAGAFKSPEDAEAQRARLAMMGMSAEISEREQSGRAVFRVRLGPFASKAAADTAREQLEGRGVQAALVRIQR